MRASRRAFALTAVCTFFAKRKVLWALYRSRDGSQLAVFAVRKQKNTIDEVYPHLVCMNAHTNQHVRSLGHSLNALASMQCYRIRNHWCMGVLKLSSMVASPWTRWLFAFSSKLGFSCLYNRISINPDNFHVMHSVNHIFHITRCEKSSDNIRRIICSEFLTLAQATTVLS